MAGIEGEPRSNVNRPDAAEANNLTKLANCLSRWHALVSDIAGSYRHPGQHPRRIGALSSRAPRRRSLGISAAEHSLDLVMAADG